MSDEGIRAVHDVIPRTSLTLGTVLPPGYVPWIPKRTDVNEEGFGAYFRDTWLIRRVRVRSAWEVIKSEADLIALAGRLSPDEQSFEQIANAIESGCVDDLVGSLPESAIDEIRHHVDEGTGSPTEGLDLGVAGVVYALAAAGCWTAASCRGHVGDHAWSAAPVVFLTADAHRIAALQPLVAVARCGFGQHEGRENLLAIEAESVVEMMRLAQLVMEARMRFTPPRLRGTHPMVRRPRTSQTPLSFDQT